jgi:hypothetical protein
MQKMEDNHKDSMEKLEAKIKEESKFQLDELNKKIENHQQEVSRVLLAIHK